MTGINNGIVSIITEKYWSYIWGIKLSAIRVFKDISRMTKGSLIITRYYLVTFMG